MVNYGVTLRWGCESLWKGGCQLELACNWDKSLYHTGFSDTVQHSPSPSPGSENRLTAASWPCQPAGLPTAHTEENLKAKSVLGTPSPKTLCFFPGTARIKPHALEDGKHFSSQLWRPKSTAKVWAGPRSLRRFWSGSVPDLPPSCGVAGKTPSASTCGRICPATASCFRVAFFLSVCLCVCLLFF